MLDFIIKYWLQFLFGLIAACFTFIIKQYYKMKAEIKEQSIKEMKAEMCSDMKANIDARITTEHEEINKRIILEHEESLKADSQIKADLEIVHVSMENLTKGVLAIQGKQFRAECRKLLMPDHEITLEEYETLVDEHDAYNALGGNHRGDALFKSVMKKWNKQLNPDTDDIE